MVIGFETVAYEVNEGQNQEFCVAVLNGELESPVEVTLTTEDGTALGEAVAMHNSDDFLHVYYCVGSNNNMIYHKVKSMHQTLYSFACMAIQFLSLLACIHLCFSPTAPGDYLSGALRIVLTESANQICVNIPTVNDTAVESTETFFAKLSTDDLRISLLPATAIIFIVDDDKEESTGGTGGT